MGTSNAYGLTPPLTRQLAFPLARRLDFPLTLWTILPPAGRAVTKLAQRSVAAPSLRDISVHP